MDQNLFAGIKDNHNTSSTALFDSQNRYSLSGFQRSRRSQLSRQRDFQDNDMN